jgi:HD-GYP domain-containing protein (c-di-GMP phosphodiesterase class II)
MMGLSTLKNYDDYTFTHTVNVCIFSVAIGRRLGLNKNRLFDLGLAALLHDVGKSRVDIDLVMKEEELSEEEAEAMQAHTWLGALNAFRLQDSGSAPLRGMITAYEHHMKVDFSGYPKARRPRELSVYSKIVALAAAYDNATLSRSDDSAKSPDVALREIWEDEDAGFDPVLVKALINLLGVYPVGTCVILDTFEVGLVHAANSDASQVNRPVVRVLSNADGGWHADPPLVDLAETQPDGSFTRSIIKVTDPDRYMINVSDYFV